MKELGVTECFRVKEQALMSAFEAAQMILRVDNIIRCAPRERKRGGCWFELMIDMLVLKYSKYKFLYLIFTNVQRILI